MASWGRTQKRKNGEEDQQIKLVFDEKSRVFEDGGGNKTHKGCGCNMRCDR